MSTTRFDEIKALAFDHYGTLFDKHASCSETCSKSPNHSKEDSFQHGSIATKGNLGTANSPSDKRI